MTVYTKEHRAQLIDKIGGRQLVVSVSGGKDSTATALLLREIGLPFRALHLCTGWETEVTDSFVRDTLPGIIGCKIEYVQAEVELDARREALARQVEAKMGLSDGVTSPMVRLILKKGMFPSRQRRFCTRELKVFPSARFFDTLDPEPISVVGVRAEESARRARMSEWEEIQVRGHATIEQWRPLIDWTWADVVAIHKRHSAPLNREYTHAERVGCMPCIYARKSEIRALADRYPQRVEVLRTLERMVAELAAERYAERGETFESLGYTPPAFFQAPVGRLGANWAIDDVIEWSRSTKGRPEQPALLHEIGGGCMRWGYCEFSLPDGEVQDG